MITVVIVVESAAGIAAVVARDPRINSYQMAVDSCHESNLHNKIVVFMYIIMAQKDHQHAPSKEYHKHSVSRTNRIKLVNVATATAWIQTTLIRAHHY